VTFPFEGGGGTVRQYVKELMAAALPSKLFLSRGAVGASRAEGAHDVALTFDDGPHPEHTPRLLDLLGTAGIRATFFVLGQEARRYPRLVARIVSEGHMIGNHTFSHVSSRRIPLETFLDEVRRTRTLVEDITGEPCRLFRPPRGELTPRALWALWREWQTVVLWNVDPRDCAMRSPEEASRWGERYRSKPGDIVLMHDDVPMGAAIVAAIAARKTRFVPISDFL